jgi:hypothetical protein
MINKESKIFLGTFSLLILISVIVTYYRYMVMKDFIFFTDEEAFNQSLLEE